MFSAFLTREILIIGALLLPLAVILSPLILAALAVQRAWQAARK